ncbi:MAG TPA: sucrase ferredoxin, partial [Thermomicrobiales bacterium]|nr:sucrase ferredoxin [Thermomicrobiales bacterium]
DRYRTDAGSVRDLLVCTHGAVDVCCGKFGYPIYQSLRDRYAPAVSPDIRVWRASHFGGHRFAPTMLDLAEGRYWAFLDDAVLRQIVERTGPIDPLLPHYRGWAGADRAWSQVAEGEAFRREGWGWLDYAKSTTTYRVDDTERHAEVRIDFTSADGLVRGAYEATVETAESRPMPLCGERPEETSHEGRQYQITRMDLV